MKYILGILCLLLTVPAIAAEKPPAVCLAPEELNNEMTPPVLFASMSACVNEGKDEQGIMLYGIGNAYLQYDLAHLNDPIAPARGSDFLTQGFVNIKGDKLAKFQDLVDKRLEDRKEILDVCRKALSLGPPAYGAADYLVAEGTDMETVLIKDVNQHYAWLSALEKSMACPINGL
jgi:hypothetical protein